MTLEPPYEPEIIPNAGGSRMGRIRPGTRLAVRKATPEEYKYEEGRIRSLYDVASDLKPEWLGHRWYVVFADDPERVLFDWFSPVGGADHEGALREAEKYANARGAEVVGATKPECTCGRPERGSTCRCTCSECWSQRLEWKAWGSYLDQDLKCKDCGHTQDIWNC